MSYSQETSDYVDYLLMKYFADRAHWVKHRHARMLAMAFHQSSQETSTPCPVCEMPDGDHLDWCTPQAREKSVR